MIKITETDILRDNWKEKFTRLIISIVRKNVKLKRNDQTFNIKQNSIVL